MSEADNDSIYVCLNGNPGLICLVLAHNKLSDDTRMTKVGHVSEFCREKFFPDDPTIKLNVLKEKVVVIKDGDGGPESLVNWPSEADVMDNEHELSALGSYGSTTENPINVVSSQHQKHDNQSREPVFDVIKQVDADLLRKADGSRVQTIQDFVSSCVKEIYGESFIMMIDGVPVPLETKLDDLYKQGYGISPDKPLTLQKVKTDKPKPRKVIRSDIKGLVENMSSSSLLFIDEIALMMINLQQQARNRTTNVNQMFPVTLRNVRLAFASLEYFTVIQSSQSLAEVEN